jgi:hypothetical protein
MSPRKTNTITVEPWPKLRAGWLYKGEIKKAQIEKASNSLRIEVENLDPTQSGRIHEIDLPLPVRPGNRTCLFLVACGINATTAGTTVCLDQITTATVDMRFRGSDANGADNFDFEKVSGPPAAMSTSTDRPRGQREDDAD